METKQKPRSKGGRPVERSKENARRVAVGLQLQAGTKNALIRIAEEQKIGFSRAAEMAIERAFAIDELLKKQGRTSIERLPVDRQIAELLASGWRSEVHAVDGEGNNLLRFYPPDPTLGPQFAFIKGEDQ
jgi:hypothetical protein